MLRLYKRSDSPFWYAAVTKSDGATVKFSTGVESRPTLRKKAFSVAEEKLRAGIDVEQGLGLKQAWAYFDVHNKRVRASTKRIYENRIVHVIAHLGDINLSRLSLKELRTYIGTRRQEGARDPAIREELDTLSSVINFCIGHDVSGAPESNVVVSLPKRMLSRERPKRYAREPEEISRVLMAAEGEWKSILTVIALTGMRKSEALGLLWSEVDLENRAIHLSAERTKSGRARSIPVLDTVFTVLASQRKLKHCPYVFPNPNTRKPFSNPHKRWVTTCKRAGVENLRIHDLRHSFATLVRVLGMSKEDRMDILGHTSPDVHDNYARSTFRSLLDSLKKTGADTVLLQVK